MWQNKEPSNKIQTSICKEKMKSLHQIIFDGICDATKQSSLKNLPKKYYDKYNIEHIK